MRALEFKLTTLQAQAVAGDDVALDIANLENQIDDLEFESHQEVHAGEAPWASIRVDLRTVYATSARQDEAGKVVGGSEQLLQTSRVLQAYRECGP
jgi:hypothetical protein